jgi:hypothetical protein
MSDNAVAPAANGVITEFDDTGLLDTVYEMLSDDRVDQGMTLLLPGLQGRRLTRNQQQWESFVRTSLNHPLRQLLHQDPFTRRAFLKPRGYAGDAELLDFVYGREEGWLLPPDISEMGRKVFDFTNRSHACEAVRARRGFIADLLDRLVEETPRPHILSVAAGHLRESLLSSAVKRRKIGRYVALDSDALSLAEVKLCYASYGVEAIQATVRQLLTRKLSLGQFDLVYSTGLFDYLPDMAAQRLTGALFQLLRPRGRLVVANFLPGILDIGYMESYMDWRLIFRTRKEMLAISMDIPQEAIHDIRIFSEESHNIIFMQITRR